MEKPAVGAVENAKTILARFDIQIRKQFPVHQNGVSKVFGDPGGFWIRRNWVVELALCVEYAIVDNQGNFVLAPGQIQRILDRVTNEEHAEQTSDHIEPVDSESVVVIPEHGSVLIIWIVVERGFSRHIPVLRIAI